jgi:hypothetical protein
MRVRMLLLAITLLAFPVRASAGPIGAFDWVHDVLFGTGSSFIVTNDSTRIFESVFVDLYSPGEFDPFQSLGLGDIDPEGGFAQTFDDLSHLLVPENVHRAVVRFVLADAVITTALLASSLEGDPTDFLIATTVIDDGAEPPPTSVPESSPTALLLLMGAAALAITRSRASRVCRVFPSGHAGPLSGC